MNKNVEELIKKNEKRAALKMKYNHIAKKIHSCGAYLSAAKKKGDVAAANDVLMRRAELETARDIVFNELEDMRLDVEYSLRFKGHLVVHGVQQDLPVELTVTKALKWRTGRLRVLSNKGEVDRSEVPYAMYGTKDIWHSFQERAGTPRVRKRNVAPKM